MRNIPKQEEQKKKPKPREPMINPKAKEILEKNNKKRTKAKNKCKTTYATHNGHKLTVKEAKFIDNYMTLGNGRQAVIEAGYNTKAPHAYSTDLLNKQYIKDEIDYRLKELEAASIADATEILQYFTSVMRGEIKDQFEIEAPLSERTKAAQELAKRQIDIANRVAGKEATAEVKITLNWEGMDDGQEDE